MKLKIKKLGANVARKIMMSLVAGSLVVCTGSFAFAAESSSGNNKTVNGENASDDINGGETESGDASNNTLTVTNTDANNKKVNGGLTGGGTANGNKVTVRNVKNIGYLHGGYAYGNGGSASNNTVYIWDSIIYHIHGGHGTALANNNKVYFYSGEVSSLTGAGWAGNGDGASGSGYRGEASFNELYVYGGTLNGTTQGGYVNGSGKANNNLVEIHGGKINGNIYGGYVDLNENGDSEVKNNRIDVYGGDLSDANLYAGYLAGNTDLFGSNNSVNFYTKGINVKNVGGFDTVSFYLPNNIQNGDTILNLSDGSAANWSNTKVRMTTNGTNLQTGDMINLVTSKNNLNVNINNVREFSPKDPTTGRNIAAHGYAWNNYVEFNQSGNTLTATVQERVQEGLTEQISILPSAVNAVKGMIDSGTDRLLDWLPPEELEMRNLTNTTEFEFFMGAGGEVMNIDTGHGSKLKNKSGGTNVGAARALKNRHGVFLFAPIVDYGTATYNSTLQNGTRGGGNAQYFTAGLIARQWNTGGMYYEASFRGGRMKTGFTSDNFLEGDELRHISYRDQAPVYTGHVRFGWRGKVSPQNVLDVYGVYSHNHIGGIMADLPLSNGSQTYLIGSQNSKRVRLGARLTRNVNDYNRFYSGIAYQYNFDSGALANFEGYSTRKTGLKGSNGIIEIGWQLKPTPNSAVMLDTSLVGWVGKQKGLSFQFKLKKDF